MVADFGILPGPSQERDPLDISDQELQRVIAEVLKQSQPPDASAPAYSSPVVHSFSWTVTPLRSASSTNHFQTGSGVSGHATPGGPPFAGGWDGAEHVGRGFDATKNPLPPSTLPGVSPPFCLESPSTSTPPEGHWRGSATPFWHGVTVAPPSTPLVPPTAPVAVSATTHSNVLNGGFSWTSSVQYGHGSSVACGLAYRYVFGEETNRVYASHDFSFQYPLPSRQSVHRSPGFSYQAFPAPTFAPPPAQHPLPSRDFVAGSSSNASHTHWLPAAPASHPSASTPFPLFSGYTATHAPPPSIPRPPAPFIDDGYTSAFYAYGGILTPSDSTAGPSALPLMLGKRRADLSRLSSPKAKAVEVSADSSRSPLAFSYAVSRTHVTSSSFSSRPTPFIDGGYASTSHAHGGALAPDDETSGPPALSAVPAKRKAEPPCCLPPTAKAAKLSPNSSPSQSIPTEGEKENQPAAFTSTSVSESQTIITHQIDWSKPQKWAGKAIDEMDVQKVLSRLSFTHEFSWDDIRRCEWNGCGKEYTRGGAVKSHVTGKAHMNLRRECLRCGYSVRADNFPSRHTQVDCDKKLAKKAKKERELAEKEARKRRRGKR